MRDGFSKDKHVTASHEIETCKCWLVQSGATETESTLIKITRNNVKLLYESDNNNKNNNNYNMGYKCEIIECFSNNKNR